MLACLIVCAAYFPSMNGEILWDDYKLVVNNPMVRTPLLAGEVFRHTLMMDGVSNYYRPVQNLSYMPCYAIGGLDPFAWHLGNCLLHALAAVLLWRVLGRTLPGRPGIALAAAALWAVHPVHNAAVAYISGRADSLAACFCLGAWLCWARGRWWTLAAAPLFLAGLMSKEIAIVWGIVFLIHEGIFATQKRTHALLWTLGGMLACIAFVFWLRASAVEMAAGATGEASSFSHRAALALRALGDYTTLTVWPASLHMERFLSTRSAWLPWAGAAAFITLCLAVAAPGPTRRLRVFATIWFFAGFLPISNLFPLNHEAAEHWIYMPVAGLLVLVCIACSALPERLHRGLPAMAVIAVVALGTRTAFRASDWASETEFYRRTTQQGGGTWRVWVNYAGAISARQGDAEGEKILRKVAALFPAEAGPRQALGTLLMRRGNSAEGMSLLNGAENKWGNALRATAIAQGSGDDKAMAVLDQAISAAPTQWSLQKAKALTLHRVGRGNDARDLIQKWVNAHWWNREARLLLGKLQGELGNHHAALQEFEMAVRLDPRDPEPWCELFRTNAALNDSTAAKESLSEAIERDPNAACVKELVAELKSVK